MKLRELNYQIGQLTSIIQHIESNNQVVIERYNRYGVTLGELKFRRELLISQKAKRFGYLKNKKKVDIVY